MRRMLCGAAQLSVVILVSSGLFSSPANAGPAPASSILEPASGALLGLYYGAGSIEQTAAKLGRTPPPVHLTYYAWTDDWTGGVSKADLATGRIPLVNWEPHKINFAKITEPSPLLPQPGPVLELSFCPYTYLPFTYITFHNLMSPRMARRLRSSGPGNG
jgi:hypothetical protein